MIYHHGDSSLVYPPVKKPDMRYIAAVDSHVGLKREREHCCFLLGLGVARMQGKHYSLSPSRLTTSINEHASQQESALSVRRITREKYTIHQHLRQR
jgi:hypothetical protein